MVETDIPAADAPALAALPATLPTGSPANDRAEARRDRGADPRRRASRVGDQPRREPSGAARATPDLDGARSRSRSSRSSIAIGAYVLAGLGKRGHVPAELALYGTIFALGFAGGAGTSARFAPRADPALFPTAARAHRRSVSR